MNQFNTTIMIIHHRSTQDPTTMRYLISAIFLSLLTVAAQSQTTELGLFYSYGASFNFHHSTKQLIRPTDGSAIGGYFQLNNGNQALGFRASLSWCHNDAVFPISEQLAIRGFQEAAELKLQCTLPLSSRSSLAIGIAPSIITSTRMILEYKNRSNGSVYGEQHALQTPEQDINELNSALCFSWYYQVRGRFYTGLHIDQDMLKLYQKNVTFLNIQGMGERTFNVRHTSLVASMIFQLK